MQDCMEECIFHCITNCKETLTKVTLRKWQSAKSYSEKWIALNNEEFIHIAKTIQENHADNFFNLVCHEACYKRFCNKLVFERAERKRQADELSTATEPSVKKTRSQVPSQMKDIGQLLPPNICIICLKERSTVRKKGSRVNDSLSQAETSSAGLLMSTAVSQNDTSLLGFVGGSHADLVAREAKYHRNCFRKYTRQIKEKELTSCITEMYNGTYQTHFRPHIIDRQLIGARRIYKLVHLAKIFTGMIRKHDDSNASEFTPALLRRRLCRDYPNLIFHSESRREGVVVFDKGSVCNDSDEDETCFNTDNFDGTTTDTTMSPIKVGGVRNYNPIADAYMTQLMLQNSITTNTYRLPWPLTSGHISVDHFQSAVPQEVLEFVGGLHKQHSDSLMPDPDKIKLVSVCQDLISLFSKRALTSPKALALGLTVKHLTGSKELITILSRLGHCASYDSVRTYETSLAQHIIANQHKIPDRFTPQALIIMVWDNIDFLEQTKSGHGTTHHTNGIMIQNDHQLPEPAPIVSSSLHGNKRSIKPVTETIPLLPSHAKTCPLHLSGVPLPSNYDLSHIDVLEFIFALVRNQDEVQKPSWTGFNKLSRSHTSSPKSVINYLPVIQAPPTDVDVVSHVLHKSLEQADKFGLETAVVVFDQAVYSKAQTVRFLNPIMQSRLVVRLGEFHTVMTFLAVIGKRFGDAGMSEILIESQCIASGSMKGVINGHSYNRSIRANKLLAESMYDLLIEQFVNSLESPTEVSSLCLDLARLTINNAGNEIKTRSQDIMNGIFKDFQRFIEERSQVSPTFMFWVGYIRMVGSLLNFIRATRESDWELHVQSIRSLLPWFFAYDHTNYARYGALYFMEMSQLQTTHPDIAQVFTSEKGSFTYQSAHHKPFSSVACDQAIEQTVNRHSKSQGGIIGFTLQPSAVQRWIATQPERAAIHQEMRKVLSLDSSMYDDGHGISQSSWAAEEDVRTVMKEVIRARINPFAHSDKKLVSITSGIEASSDVMADLEKAHEHGEQKLALFVASRLSSQEDSFYSTLKASKLKTFAFHNIKTKKAQPKTLLCSGRIFDRLLVISQQRNVDMKAVMSYSLGEISWSLASLDGLPLKTAKSALMGALECDLNKDTSYVKLEDLPIFDSVIIDGMAEIQTVKTTGTFGELADILLKRVVSITLAYRSKRADFICDTYPTNSIKGIERNRRGAKGRQRVSVFGPNQKVPVKYSEFLAEGSNKEALSQFLFEHWSTQRLEVDLDVVVAFKTECHHITFRKDHNTTSQPILNLTSDHEEADTRIFLHLRYVTEIVGDKVLIKCQDTDVFVLALGLLPELSSHRIYLLTGKGERMRYIHIGEAVTQLTPPLCQALVGLHAVTGCDSVSSFFGKGKRMAYKVLKKNEQLFNAFSRLGVEFEVPSDVRKGIEAFVCKLYNVDTENINEARYTVFCSPTRVSQKNLPPTLDELNLHITRAGYQAGIWRRSTQNKIIPPSVENHGWRKEGDELSVVWMTQDPAPPSVLKDMFCKCKTGCAGNRCNCQKAGLKCTDVCQCHDCQNRRQRENGEAEAEDQSDTDYSDDSEIDDI